MSSYYVYKSSVNVHLIIDDIFDSENVNLEKMPLENLEQAISNLAYKIEQQGITLKDLPSGPFFEILKSYMDELDYSFGIGNSDYESLMHLKANNFVYPDYHHYRNYLIGDSENPLETLCQLVLIQGISEIYKSNDFNLEIFSELSNVVIRFKKGKFFSADVDYIKSDNFEVISTNMENLFVPSFKISQEEINNFYLSSFKDKLYEKKTELD